MVGQHRPRGHAYRQQLSALPNDGLHFIRPHKVQVRDQAQLGQLLQGFPFPLQQQPLAICQPMPPQLLHLTFDRTVQRHHMHPMLAPQPALRQGRPQQGRPLGDNSFSHLQALCEQTSDRFG